MSRPSPAPSLEQLRGPTIHRRGESPCMFNFFGCLFSLGLYLFSQKQGNNIYVLLQCFYV